MQRFFVLCCVMFFALACMGAAGESALPLDGLQVVEVSATPAPVESAPLVPVESAPALAGKVCAVVIASDALHLRGAASQNAEVLTWLKNGVVVEVIDSTGGDWWRVDVGGVVGFARSAYLQFAECEG